MDAKWMEEYELTESHQMYCNFTLRLLSCSLRMLRLSVSKEGVIMELAHQMYMQIQCNKVYKRYRYNAYYLG